MNRDSKNPHPALSIIKRLPVLKVTRKPLLRAFAQIQHPPAISVTTAIDMPIRPLDSFIGHATRSGTGKLKMQTTIQAT